MKNIILSLLVLVMASTANAANYGMAGCGLGSIVMGSSGSQVLAATTNGTFYSQLFGITSGTSNCTDAGVVSKAAELPTFIEANRVEISNDLARGEGETLSHLATILGCNDSVALGSELKKDYKRIFSSSQVTNFQVSGSIRKVVIENKSLKASCSGMLVSN